MFATKHSKMVSKLLLAQVFQEFSNLFCRTLHCTLVLQGTRELNQQSEGFMCCTSESFSLAMTQLIDVGASDQTFPPKRCIRHIDTVSE